MARTLPGTGLLDIEPNAPGQAVVQNELNALFDAAFGSLRVLDRDLTAPPGGESDGDLYIVASPATGDWAGQENNLAYFLNGAYLFVTPQSGWYVSVIDEERQVVFDGTIWHGATFLAVESGFSSTNSNNQGQGPLPPEEQVVEVTTTQPNGTVTLPPIVKTGQHCLIVNRGSNSLNVYPDVGDEIDDLGTNNADSIAVNATATYVVVSANNWYRWHR